MKLTTSEKLRLDAVIETVAQGDWHRFVELSDKDFANESAMRTQFSDSSEVLRRLKGAWSLEAEARLHSDGTRVIFGKIVPNESSILPLCVTLHSGGPNEQKKIWTLTFFQEFDWN